ncbi:PREDICTED: crossover junction endonuclease EME1 isoform X2 [Lepidothrix coronata]|uniref:Crossover junction endonuclease EME1 isoform X2 n=1 Tax=Lepidothrix coronata TaxID=321398 RepID=A0A6J0H0N0_9PASS|nr:PREDICTED: crossover junction endonuclease EME1 isoform X2 [Lepidothrix coronata]
MAEPCSESGSEEELPTLSSLLEPHKPSPPRPPSPDPEVVVVSSGGEEAEEEVVVEEVAALRGRVAARGGAGFEPCWQPHGGLCASGDLVALGGEGPWGDPAPSGGGFWGGENSTCGAEGPALLVGQDEPSSPLVSGASTEASPLPKKRQYSQREREAVCQAAWERRKEREAKRRLQEEEKERKRALAKTLKAQRPGECQKYITVVLDPVLLQVEGGEQILRALEAANYSCVVENQAVPCSITWRRKTVSSQKVDSCTEGQKMTLQSYVAHVMEKLPGKILALAVVGVENYFRSLGVQSKQRLQQAAAPGNQEEQRKGRKKKIKDSGLEFARMDMEEALVDLQLCTRVQVSFFDSCEELGEYATMFTKAVAEAPFKREREDTGFSFYLEKRWCGGVKVDHSGKGLLKVWNRQIQQFNRVSPAMAEAIVSAYPSPQLLIQAYGKCSSDQERENMLANIPVHRGEGVTATSRRIGPELSRRIYLQMTSHNPDLCLDLTG